MSVDSMDSYELNMANVKPSEIIVMASAGDT